MAQQETTRTTLKTTLENIERKIEWKQTDLNKGIERFQRYIAEMTEDSIDFIPNELKKIQNDKEQLAELYRQKGLLSYILNKKGA